jgi:hypothetical protein
MVVLLHLENLFDLLIGGLHSFAAHPFTMSAENALFRGA